MAAEESAELAKHQNHARVLQVKSLLNNMAGWIEHKIRTETVPLEARALLQITPPLIIDHDYPKGSTKREKLFSEADEGFKIAFEEGFVLKTMNELESAVGERASQITNINLDKPSVVYPSAVIIYRGREEKLEEVRQEGFLRGRTKLLQMLSGETPLAVWRKDLAGRFLSLTPTVDGGEVGFLPTIIPNVFVRYYYAKKATLPQVFLEVRSFT